MRKLVLLLLSALIILSGCGDGGSAPEGSTIKINPGSSTIEPLSADTTATAWETVHYTISVLNPSGFLAGKTSLIITCPLATGNGQVRLLGGSSTASPLYVETDETGVYYLNVQVQVGGGLNYNNTIEVRSGSAYASATFTVSDTTTSGTATPVTQ